MSTVLWQEAMANLTPHPPGSTSSDVCLSCGLCCDGTIFADVRLKRGDDAARFELSKLPALPSVAPGSQYQRKDWIGSSADLPPVRVPQPCAALSGCRCQIYPQRPDHCRKFECLLLRRMESGEADRATALRLILRTRRQAERVRRLLSRLGDSREDLSLHRRFRSLTRRLEESALDKATAKLYGDLTIAMHDLNFQLSRHFYPERA